MKPRRYKTRYIVSVFRNRRGAGLLIVFGHSRKEAEQNAKNLIGRRKLEIASVQTFREYATPTMMQYAVEDMIYRNWNPLMHK